MAEVGAVFDFVGNTFVAIAETLRGVFNIFQIAGNTLMEGLGAFLENLGSWVSKDLENFGKTLRENGLAEVETIASVTSRLIVNRTALKTRPVEVQGWIDRFREAANAA
jgi:hypothetical protein